MKSKNILGFSFSFLLALAAQRIEASQLSIHITVTCLSSKPSLIASFEEAKSSQETKFCQFLALTGNVTSQEQASWQSRMAVLQGMSLRVLPAVSQTKQGFRKDEVDSQGRIRRSTWTWGASMVNQIALFDDQGLILQLDRWKNQRSIPDSMAPTFNCGRTFTHSSFSFGSVTQTGLSDDAVFALGSLADRTVYSSLGHDLGLATDVCTPAGLHYTEMVPYPPLQAMALTPAPTVVSRNPTHRSAFDRASSGLGGKSNEVLRVFPNPASSQATITYNLARSGVVGIVISDLNGAEIRNLTQGSQEAGSYDVSVGLDGIASGVYLVSLVLNQGQEEKAIATFKLAIKH